MNKDKIIDLSRLSEFKEKILSLIPTKVSQLNNDSEYVKQTDIENLKKSVSDGKTMVANAITDKGIETAADAEFATIAENVEKIETVSDIKLQEKTVKSSKQQFSIIPDTGYNGISKVTVNPINLTDYEMKSFITTDPNASIVGSLIGNIGQQYDGISQVKLSGVLVQSKTVSPSTSVQTVKPDSGYDVLNSVTINAIKNQSKSVTPTTSVQTIKPDSGYNGLLQVTVNAAKLQNKSVTPTSSVQTIYPDSGFYGLGAVSVSAASSGEVKTGTITLSTTEQTINIGFNPKLLILATSQMCIMFCYNIRQTYEVRYNLTSGNILSYVIGSSSAFIQSIGSTTKIKCTITSSFVNKEFNWYAIG